MVEAIGAGLIGNTVTLDLSSTDSKGVYLFHFTEHNSYGRAFVGIKATKDGYQQGTTATQVDCSIRADVVDIQLDPI